MIDDRFREVVADLKAYFEYLTKIGITEQTLSESGFKDVAQSQLQTLEEIRGEFGDCSRCKLHRTRRTLVFGEGNKKADLMIIGEAPGYDEDIQGKPFVGRAGQLLTKILQSIQIERNEVYITNIVKCRPPQNRNPEADEIQSCYPFLLKQILAIQPKIICALGTFSAQTLLKTDAKISNLRGRFYELSGIKLIPTYHPAYLLRNPERKKEVWEDMKKISKWMVDNKLSQLPGENMR